MTRDAKVVGSIPGTGTYVPGQTFHLHASPQITQVLKWVPSRILSLQAPVKWSPVIESNDWGKNM